MKLLGQTQKTGGQALIELMIILPIFLLFVSAVLPIIANGISLPWLDERLTLRQLSHGKTRIHYLLQKTHSSDLLPPYFNENDIIESTEIIHRNASLPLVSKIFSSDMTRKLTTAKLPQHGWWNHELFREPQKQELQISRDLTMVTAQILAETRVPEKVKKWSFIGIVPGKTNILRKTGFKLFHLNLNALPDEEEKTGK